MKKAIYAGTFDPFTFGHLSVAINAARLFDEVKILIAVNQDKECMFSAEKRLEIINKVIRGFSAISADSTDGYVVAYATSNSYDFMVRGIRNSTDAAAEITLAELNSSLAPSIQTVLIPANPTLSSVSSSELKRLFSQNDKAVHSYCPPEVIAAMKERSS